jgi:SnoaL-like domain
MSSEDTRTTWETYASAWREKSAEAKRAALSASVDPACVYRDPLARADGHDALVEYMSKFHEQVPGGCFETMYFLAHHDRSIAKWNVRDGRDAIVGEGVSYGEYDGRGRLVAMTGFFEAPQR